MAIAKYCGHNRRGEIIENDDLPKITENFLKWYSKNA